MWRLIMGSGYSSEEEQETQDQKPPIMEAEEEPDVIATDFGGREQGDGMEKEEEQPVQTYEDQHLSKTPLLEIQQKEVEEPALPSLCQGELLNSGPPASAPSMESANIIRKPAGLLLPEAGGLVISKLPPIHDDVDLRPTPTVCSNILLSST